jgi:hypothetical protein
MITSYRFTSVTDPNNAWTNDDNVNDGNDLTGATPSGTGSTNYIVLQSPIVPISGRRISTVGVHVKNASVQTSSVSLWIKSTNTQVDGTVILGAVAEGTALFPSPDGQGWQWSQLADLEARVYVNTSGVLLNTVDLAVRHYACAWPLSWVFTDVIPLTAATRYNGFGCGPDSVWQSSQSNASMICPHEMVIRRFLAQISTALGVSGMNFSAAANGVQSPLVTLNFGAADTFQGDLGINQHLKSALDRFETRVDTVAGTIQPTWYRFLTYMFSESFPLMAGSNSTVSTAATRFLPVQGTGNNATNTNVSQVVPVAGIISNLTVQNLTSALTSGSWTVELFKNSSATGLKVTVDNTGTTFTDTTHVVTVAPGDVLVWQLSPSAPNAAKTFAISASFDSIEGTFTGGLSSGSNVITGVSSIGNAPLPQRYEGLPISDSSGFIPVGTTIQDIDRQAGTITLSANATGGNPSVNLTIGARGAGTGLGLLLSGSGSTISASNVFNWIGAGGWNATEAIRQAMGGNAHYVALYVALSGTAGGVNGRTVSLRRNGVVTPLAVTLIGTTLTGSDVDDIGVSERDLISVGIVNTGTPTAASIKWGLAYETFPRLPIITEG